MVFSSEPEVIIKHCPIRWLSLLHCVECYISQLEGMKSYFKSCNEENVKVRNILARRSTFRASFMSSCIYHAFNESVQFSASKSDENTICEVYTLIERAYEVVCCKSSKGRSHYFCRTV